MSKRKGAYYEHRAIRILEAAGYVCTRAGGSLGVFDVIAIGPRDVRAVQVKGGARNYLSGVEREAIALLAVPANVSKEAWRFVKHARAPLIERL
jgi:Holliday junction resolvase